MKTNYKIPLKGAKCRQVEGQLMTYQKTLKKYLYASAAPTLQLERTYHHIPDFSFE
jgi:hypothetical protein